MKKLLILALITGLVTAFGLSAIAANAPSTLNFAAPTKGAVTFDHAAHEGRAADCKSCHHYGVGNGKCVDCHTKLEGAPPIKRAFHRNCRTCHNDRWQARDCGYCHK